jgi:opacity protein-like surface antigen
MLILRGLCIAMSGGLNLEAVAEDVAFNLGVRGWVNQWTVKYSGSKNTSDWIAMVGPTLKISYKNFFGGATFLQAVSDYHLPTESWSRKELDAVVGYMLHPSIGILLGYKYMSGSTNNGVSHTANGLAFGATINYPIQDLHLTPYINGVYMPLSGELTFNNGDFTKVSSTQRYDIIGYSFEAGLAYQISRRWSANLGYKYQNLDWKGVARDILSGFTIGLNYSF